MRILFLCNRDLASNVALNLLWPAWSGHEVRVALTERVGSADATEAVERRELRGAEQTYPNEVFFPLIERARFADDGRRYLTFGELERLRGIPVATLANPNGPAGLAAVRTLAPDVIVSVRYGAILRSEVLAIPKYGVLNLHSGLLPSYRGVLATFRALMNGDAEIGCTLHRIADATIDTGDIVATGRLRVSRERSLLGHVLALYPIGAELIARALGQLEGGHPLPTSRQPEGEGRYFSYPTAEDWAEFTRRGLAVANPSELLGIYERYLPRASSAAA